MERANPRAVALSLAGAAVALFAVALAVMPVMLGLDAMPGLIVLSVVLIVGAGALIGMAVAARKAGQRQR